MMSSTGIGDRYERVFDYEYLKRTYGIERIQRIILSEMGNRREIKGVKRKPGD